MQSLFATLGEKTQQPAGPAPGRAERLSRLRRANQDAAAFEIAEPLFERRRRPPSN